MFLLLERVAFFFLVAAGMVPLGVLCFVLLVRIATMRQEKVADVVEPTKAPSEPFRGSNTIFGSQKV